MVKQVYIIFYNKPKQFCSIRLHRVFLALIFLKKLVVQENRRVGSGQWMGKVNFVEIRSFWHIFRSFDRMWSFLILSLQVNCQSMPSIAHVFLVVWLIRKYKCLLFLCFMQAMIIIAWNGGTPSDIFDAGVFKQVLSIFITAAILKLGQGMLV